jgi:dipeptidyl aminopeptidase/acylaminoacyl peptidase
VLRDQRGEVVMRLETADIEPLLETGWRAPQAFSAKARDGKTDIFGAMFFPSGFSPLRKYPVIDAIYPGPQVLRTPKRFPGEDDRSLKWYWEPQALAELGFIVVTIDGMGTPYRSRSFLEVSYGRQFGEAGGLEDHVAALNELGTRHEFMDTSKVGIYGHSGGGYASTRAMLKFPDFFKVAVSSAGNHNQLGYLNSWGEFWMGLYDPDTYSEQSNFDLAANLKGKLLLVHGDLDDNVHPALTMRMVYEFIKEDKDFDMLILPGRNHHMTDLTERSQKSGFIGDPYLMRKTWDYFVLHLMGATPPKYSLGRTRE